MQEGLAGKIAKSFINSKLTVLLMIIFMVVGVYTSFLIPREEEPQIDVAMADIFVGYPGASPKEVESRVVKPLEKVISNIKGVEYVYSTSMKDQAMVIVQFYVGEDIERSFVKLYNEMNKHMDLMPKGVTMPLVKTRAIDDVPMMGLTLWSETQSDYELKQIAQELTTEIEKVQDVAITKIVGGRNRSLKVLLDKDKLAARSLDVLSIASYIGAAHQQLNAGSIQTADHELLISSGTFLSSAEDVSNLVVGVDHNKPVFLREVAQVVDGPEDPTSYVSHGYGAALAEKQAANASEYPALTI